ncbi:MAG: hypothetical protein ING71_07925 [Rhodocyclaceae bacterium]|nr:hypothetical protein [Rhodocyclaceae bacterium]MCA4910379.1 hypothetical protein [Methylobacterium sp.]
MQRQKLVAGETGRGVKHAMHVTNTRWMIRIANMKNVLGDHIRKGKTLVPPFIASLGAMHGVSWNRLIVPELLWISLLHKACGDHEAVRIITAVTRTARNIFNDDKKRKFCFMSEWVDFPDKYALEFRNNLQEDVDISVLEEALMPLLALYPECPFKRILGSVLPTIHKSNELDALGTLVRELFNRNDRHATMVQASAIWTSFDCGQLVVAEGLSLARFPEIEAYPNTEISRQIAGSIRATMNAMAGRELQPREGWSWSTYFWNRGVEISECNIGE